MWKLIFIITAVLALLIAIHGGSTERKFSLRNVFDNKDNYFDENGNKIAFKCIENKFKLLDILDTEVDLETAKKIFFILSVLCLKAEWPELIDTSFPHNLSNIKYRDDFEDCFKYELYKLDPKLTLLEDTQGKHLYPNPLFCTLSNKRSYLEKAISDPSLLNARNEINLKCGKKNYFEIFAWSIGVMMMEPDESKKAEIKRKILDQIELQLEDVLDCYTKPLKSKPKDQKLNLLIAMLAIITFVIVAILMFFYVRK